MTWNPLVYYTPFLSLDTAEVNQRFYAGGRAEQKPECGTGFHASLQLQSRYHFVRVCSRDPFVGFNYFSGIISAHRNVDWPH